jgi:hypothetical protein
MARPVKLTAAVSERIVQAIRAGNYPEPAARAAGISPSTYYRWMTRGQQEPTGIFHDFAETVARAEGEAEVHAVAFIRRAMSADWRAALAYVERRHPERWRRQQTTELVARQADQQPTLDIARLSDEELTLLEQLHRRAAEPD